MCRCQDPIEGMEKGDVPDVICSAYLGGMTQEARQWYRVLVP